MLKQKHKKEILENGLFDFIAKNYCQLEKSDIITLCREFNYAVYDLDKKLCKEAEQKMWEEIEENEELESDEEL